MTSIKTTIFPTLGDVNPLNLLICEQVAKPSTLCDPKSNPRKIRKLKCRDSFFYKKGGDTLRRFFWALTTYILVVK